MRAGGNKAGCSCVFPRPQGGEIHGKTARGALALLLCLCLLLTSCGGTGANILGGGNVEDLLRAPRTDAQQSAVQTALNAYLGETLQLKYPRGGMQPDPVVFADLDGDGVQEAAVLYTAQSKGQNVHLSVLEPAGDGWNVAYEVMGLSTEVAEVALCEVFPGSVQLLVGYANQNLADKYLEVYDYYNVTVYSACRQPYDAYWMGTGTEGNVLLAIAAGIQQAGAGTVLTLYEPMERALVNTQTAILDERLEKCTGLSGTAFGSQRGFVVDGQTADGAASQFLELREGALTLCADNDLGGAACYVRPQALRGLVPQDLDGSGELLAAAAGESVATPRSEGRFYIVDWMDGMRTVPLRQSGIFDARGGVYIRMPDPWRETVQIAEQTDTSWQLRRREDNALLCTVRSAAVRSPGDTDSAAGAEDSDIQLEFGEACSAWERRVLSEGVMRFS